MKKMRRIVALAVGTVLLAGIVAGCGKTNEGTSGGSTSGNAEETSGGEGGKISIAVTGGDEDAMVIDTAQSGTLEGLSACRHLYEGLYKLDANGEVVLGQASDVSMSDDGLTYTFTIRDDANWSDGEAVKAEDFVYGWQYLKDCARDYSSLLDMITDSSAQDDKTLVVTLAYPCSYLPSVLAFPSAYPVRKDMVDEFGEAYATDPEKALYNGAYELTQWNHQESLIMTAREDYYDYDALGTGEITWDLMADPSTMLASFESGDIVFSSNYPEEESASLKDKGVQYASGYNSYCIMFNISDKGPAALKDEKVRQALSLAVDRQRLVDVRNLEDEVAVTYAPSGLTDESKTEFNSTVDPWFDLDAYESNCSEAKNLLKEAGYENGKGFPTMKYIVNNDDRREIAEAVISDWKEVLGIDSITVETVDGFFAQRQSKDYDIAYFGWYMDYPDVSNMMYTMYTGASDSGYSNPAYDEAYDAATAATDTKTQWESYKKCEEILSQDMPIAPLFHGQNTYLFDDTIYQGLVYYCGNYYFGYVTEK